MSFEIMFEHREIVSALKCVWGFLLQRVRPLQDKEN